MRRFLRRYMPKSVVNLYHLFFAWWGAVKYCHPSEELFVIGVTGTSGKSSTVYFLKHILEQGGLKVGALSTIEFSVAGTTMLNNKKMTMLGKMEIQRYLREMVKVGCTVAIIETTSEGYVQHRHRFINYDLIALTNLYPEHIESHGSYEKYKAAKLGIFSHVATCPRKSIAPHKIAIVNGHTKEAGEFLQFPFEKKIGFGRQDLPLVIGKTDETYLAENVSVSSTGLHFTVAGHSFHAPVYGIHNVFNLLVAIAVARARAISWEKIIAAMATLPPVPGRLEFIPEAKRHGFQVIVDYAFEPVAMQALYETVTLIKPKRIIHVFGSTGGGRDRARRFTVGEMVGKQADLCIVTNEDPYDDDPEAIMDDVATALGRTGKILNHTYWKIADRKEAIARALSMAQPGDMVLVTGKGSEQGMVVKGKMVPWDDRQCVREGLALL